MVFYDFCLEIASFSLQRNKFAVYQDLDVWMSTDIIKFWRQYSDSAVISRVGLIELCHTATDVAVFIEQIDLYPFISQI